MERFGCWWRFLCFVDLYQWCFWGLSSLKRLYTCCHPDSVFYCLTYWVLWFWRSNCTISIVVFLRRSIYKYWWLVHWEEWCNPSMCWKHCKVEWLWHRWWLLGLQRVSPFLGNRLRHSMTESTNWDILHNFIQTTGLYYFSITDSICLVNLECNFIKRRLLRQQPNFHWFLNHRYSKWLVWKWNRWLLLIQRLCWIGICNHRIGC